MLLAGSTEGAERCLECCLLSNAQAGGNRLSGVSGRRDLAVPMMRVVGFEAVWLRGNILGHGQ